VHDVVGDILEERASLSPRWSIGAAGSAFLHLVIGAMFLLAASRSTLPARNVIMLRLAQPSAPVSGAQPAAPKAAAAPLVAAAPAALPKEESKPLMRPVTPSLYGKSTEKPGLAPQLPHTTPASPPAATSTAVPAIGSASVTGIEGGDFPYTTYLNRMTTLIAGHWFRPQSKEEVVVVIAFVIDRDGTLRDARIEKSSGNPLFDRAAYRAILEASPLPPLPFAYSGTRLGVHLTFH
jgi:periplasmic protein TonB